MFGFKAYFGDATRPDLLEAAGIREEKLLIIAIDDKQQITELTHYVCHNYPDVHVVARAVDRHHVYELYGARCRDIVRETFDSSVRAGRSALVALGISDEQAQQIATGFVADDRTSMIVLADAYDPDIPSAENPTYLSKAKEVIATQEALLEQGPDGFGQLDAKLKELGEDPAILIEKYRLESQS